MADCLEDVVLHVGVDNGRLGGVGVHLHPVAEAEAQQAALTELYASRSAPNLTFQQDVTTLAFSSIT